MHVQYVVVTASLESYLQGNTTLRTPLLLHTNFFVKKYTIAHYDSFNRKFKFDACTFLSWFYFSLPDQDNVCTAHFTTADVDGIFRISLIWYNGTKNYIVGCSGTPFGQAAEWKERVFVIILGSPLQSTKFRNYGDARRIRFFLRYIFLILVNVRWYFILSFLIVLPLSNWANLNALRIGQTATDDFIITAMITAFIRHQRNLTFHLFLLLTT